MKKHQKYNALGNPIDPDMIHDSKPMKPEILFLSGDHVFDQTAELYCLRPAAFSPFVSFDNHPGEVPDPLRLALYSNLR